MIAASIPRHAQVRIIAPVFWAISGSNRASRKGASGFVILCVKAKVWRGKKPFGERREREREARGFGLWTSNSIDAKSRIEPIQGRDPAGAGATRTLGVELTINGRSRRCSFRRDPGGGIFEAAVSAARKMLSLPTLE